jgi:molybdopterin biosynthesis enzyme
MDWVNVEEALARLRELLVSSIWGETISLSKARGRVSTENAMRGDPIRLKRILPWMGKGAPMLRPRGGVLRFPLVAERTATGLLSDGPVPLGQQIVLKPGRQLALIHWHGVPVFGAPGNPVPVFVGALVFVRPALADLVGQGVCAEGFIAVAVCSENKNAGR